jgi:hypothetical protein
VGLSGTILYTTTGIISNTNFPTNYIFDLPAGPYLSNGQPYTITLQDITIGGLSTGYLNIIGITPVANTAFGINVFPRIELFPTLIPFTESHNTPSAINTVAGTEYIYYKLSPFSAGPNYGLLNAISYFNNYGAPANVTFSIREGSGLSGNILAQKTQFCPNGSTEISFNDNPLMYRAIGVANYYTITITSDAPGVIVNAGDSIDYTFSSYGASEIYSQLLPATSNLAGAFRSGINIPFTDSGAIFVASTTLPFRSITLSLSGYDALSSTRDISIDILNGSGLGNPSIYSETFSIPISRYISMITLSASAFPTLTAGNFYTLVVKDVSSPASGLFEMYGIVPSATFVTDTLSIYPKTDIQGTLIVASSTFSQPSNPNIVDTVNGTYTQGYRFVPTVSGTLTTLNITLSSYSQLLSRTINYKIVSGGGIAGAVLTSGTITLANSVNGSRQSVEFQIGAPSLTSGNTYTLVLQDPNIVGDGNITLFGTTPDGTYIAYNSPTVYPELYIYDGNVSMCYQQTSNPSLFALVNTLSPIGYYMRSTFSGFLSTITLSLFSYDISGSRSLRIRICESNGLPPPFPAPVYVMDETFTVTNSDARTDFVFTPVPFSVSLVSTTIYTLIVEDVSAGGVGSGSIYFYGINPEGYYIPFSTAIYPKLSLYTPAAIITIEPPKDFSKFLNNLTDNISFNVASIENALTLNYSSLNLGPSRMTYWQIGFKYLSMPNLVLKNNYGGRLNAYSNLYIQVYNEGIQGNNNGIYSNDPTSTLATFIIPIDRYLYSIPSAFFTFHNYVPPQIIRFRPDQAVRFRIVLDDGSPIEFEPDTQPPEMPNPFVQVRALFSLFPVPEYINK